ncbi:hypothetical protein B9N43_10085 [Denitratisoma sp. DHT3]|uniref:hypothetical protein n=1 Tax=Denitratisoma sp. DHT3 TaxID=1981880 RepID=UPI0011983467|nr:hypothetical protein [Denitratisoma sp. DHT3]QDX81566.1 hypothetical protein B9N43_10085 [Denitratisoma sp. DHT3]
MPDRIRQILSQISALDEELRTALHEQESRLRYKIQGRRVHFEEHIRAAHRRLRMGLVRWLLESRVQSLVSVPIIYGMALPLVLFDLCITFYQWTCFPLYGIKRVRRRDYFVFDRSHLAYLNLFEKINCAYCSYGNGLLAYAAEITARTEQYWCPIKHARKVLGAHGRYAHFLPYGEAADYQDRLAEFRRALNEKTDGDG